MSVQVQTLLFDMVKLLAEINSELQANWIVKAKLYIFMISCSNSSG